MKLKKENIKDRLIIFYLSIFCFCMLFGFNDEHIEDAVNLKYMVVPYININITMFLACSSFVMICLILIFKKFKIDKIVLLFIVRILLYCIPITYISGEFKIGTLYAIIQCVFAYFIGINLTTKNKNIINVLFLFSIGIACEVFYTLIANNLTIFSDNIKWFMVIPLGKSNYISCYLVPLYVIVSRYYEQNKKFYLIYTVVMLLAVLGTSSKLALILMIAYIIYQFIQKNFRGKRIAKRKIILVFIEIILIIIVAIIFIYKNQKGIETIISRFTTTNIFEARIYVYKEALGLIYNNPLFGRSAYKFKVYDTYKAHNFILESLVQTGIIGTIILAMIFYFVIKNIINIEEYKIKYAIKGFIVIYLIQGLIEPNLFIAVSDTFFWTIVATITSKNLKDTYVSKV